MTQRLFLMALALSLFSFSTGCNLIVGDNNNGNTNTNDNTDNDNDDNDNGNENDNFADFTNPDDTAFRTSDVFDVDGDIVRFNTETDAIVWAEDGTEYQPGSWTVNGNLLAGGGFQVRFGTEGGVKRRTSPKLAQPLSARFRCLALRSLFRRQTCRFRRIRSYPQNCRSF